MATQRALPYPDTSSSPPGIALVRGLDASATFKPSYWERSLVRLCLYPLPAIWAAFHLAAAHATLAHLSDNLADLRFLVALSFTWIAATEFFHAVGCERSNREHTGAMAVLVSVFVASGAAALLLILLDIHLPGILPCASEAAFLFFASVIVKIWLKRIFRSHGRTTSVAVVDTYIHRGEVSWILARKRVSRHEISGAIRLDELGTSGVTKIFHSMDELVKEIQCEPTEGVLISALPEYTSILSQSLSAHGGVDAPVRFVLDSRDSAVSRQRFSSANCIYLMNTGAEPEKTLHYLILKRAFDIMFSLVAIIAGLPLIALIALAIKISSRGGIFFVQDRVGWNGKIFRMYKFRTMHAVPPR